MLFKYKNILIIYSILILLNVNYCNGQQNNVDNVEANEIENYDNYFDSNMNNNENNENNENYVNEEIYRVVTTKRPNIKNKYDVIETVQKTDFHRFLIQTHKICILLQKFIDSILQFLPEPPSDLRIDTYDVPTSIHYLLKTREYLKTIRRIVHMIQLLIENRYLNNRGSLTASRQQFTRIPTSEGRLFTNLFFTLIPEIGFGRCYMTQGYPDEPMYLFPIVFFNDIFERLTGKPKLIDTETLLSIEMVNNLDDNSLRARKRRRRRRKLENHFGKRNVRSPNIETTTMKSNDMQEEDENKNSTRRCFISYGLESLLRLTEITNIYAPRIRFLLRSKPYFEKAQYIARQIQLFIEYHLLPERYGKVKSEFEGRLFTNQFFQYMAEIKFSRCYMNRVYPDKPFYMFPFQFLYDLADRAENKTIEALDRENLPFSKKIKNSLIEFSNGLDQLNKEYSEKISSPYDKVLNCFENYNKCNIRALFGMMSATTTTTTTTTPSSESDLSEEELQEARRRNCYITYGLRQILRLIRRAITFF